MVFECLDNCGKCCQPIMLDEERWEYLKASAVCEYVEVWYEHEGKRCVVPRRADDGSKCVFLDEMMRCVIYDDRPKVCREYGVVTKCPYVREDGSLRTAEDTQRIGATICLQYALAAALLPLEEQDLIDRLLELDPLAFYEATFRCGVRVQECMREQDGAARVDVDVEVFPRLREYLDGMGIHLEV